MKITLVAATFVTVFTSSVAVAQRNPVVGRAVEGWTIRRSIDAMTYERSCVAYLNDDVNFQLTDDSFAINYRGRGGVSGYRVRLDDNPASEMQLPSRIEQRVGAVIIRGGLFNQIRQARRVRVQALTLTSGMANDDLNVGNLNAVLGVLTGPECTGTGS